MPRWHLRSTAMRLSLRYALLYSVLATLMFAVAFFVLRGELREWIEDDLMTVRAELSRIYRNEGREGLMREIGRRIAPDEESQMIYQLTDAGGRWLGGNVRGLSGPNAKGLAEVGTFEMIGTFDEEISSFETRVAVFPDASVVLGKSRHLYHEVLEVFLVVLAICLIPLLLIGVLLGTLVGRRTEERINAVRTTLADVALGDLAQRVADTRGDDIGRVGQAIDAALGRLQALVESQQQISADIAHDLKTPIQRLRLRLEGLRDHWDAEQIESCIAETDTIIDTFQALLRIAQIDGGARRERFCAVDLNTVALTVADVFEASLEEAGFSLNLHIAEQPVILQGDRELLAQLVSNLIDNAIRHCPPSTVLELRTSIRGGKAVLTVADTGPGIPAEERANVFRRLYRLDKSRTSGGSGLGLSMVRAIADLHGAGITLSDNAPGLAVIVEFPVNSVVRNVTER